MKHNDLSNKSSISSVLFDLDGTLLDTADDLGAALNFVLKKYNRETIAPADYRPVASDGALGLLKLGFGKALVNYDYDELRQQFLDYYQQNIAEHTKLYPGVAELLIKLESQNIPWGIVTNKPEGLTKQLLPFFKEFAQCAVMVAGDTLTKRKPDPEPLLYACRQIDTDPSKSLYIGDAQRDIEAGNRATMTTFVAKWGYILADENCASWQADFLLEDPTSLLHWLAPKP